MAFNPWYADPFLDPSIGFVEQFMPPFVTGGQPTTRRRIGEGESVPTPPGTIGRAPNVVGAPGWTRSLPVDFIEREKEFVVRCDIPGVKKEEIHVDVHDKNVLRFGHNPHAEREKEDEEEKGIFHRAERVSSFRNRNLRMPENADMEGEIKAAYHDGVLEIRVGKKKEPKLPEPKQISVE